MPRAEKKAKRKTSKRPELAENLNRVLREHFLIKAGERVGVAVSGGADSVALLRILLELRAELGIVPVVVHFNHQLRGKASDADERFVRQLAAQYGLEFYAGRADVAELTRGEKGNLEEVARRARYSFFEKLQKEGRVARVAVAHTADDQAETVLAHILRGTGLGGLRGIHSQTPLVFRPLLGVRRRELRIYLKALKQAWREDATNRDTRRTRARIRKKLLPLLEKEFNPAVVEQLCRLGELAGEAEDFLELSAAELLKGLTQQSPGKMAIRLGDLLSAPRAMQARVLRSAVARVKARGGQLGKAHVDAVLELAGKKDSGRALQLPGGVVVRRDRELLRLRAVSGSAKSGEADEARNYEYKIDLRGGRMQLPLVQLSCLLHLREIDWPAEGGETREIGAVLDSGRLRQPLLVRAWKPGDAMRPRGHRKAHSLARLLNEQGVSRWEKQEWPVLTSAGKVAWARGLAEAEEFSARADTQRAIVISEEPLL